MSETTTPALLALQAANSLRTFAPLIRSTPSGLAYSLYKIPSTDHYYEFTIPKKSGGKRLIRAPSPRLKLLQRNLASLLTQCFEEIASSTQDLRSVSHGFRPHHSIVTNARAHRHKRYVLNLDLENFFEAINFGRVRGFFISDRHFSLDPKVATIIAQISCHDNSLPQGAPTSPIVSNLIGQILDARLAKLAKLHGCYYTRYVDDLTFSTRAHHFPVALCVQRTDRNNIWEIGADLRDCIERTGFSINACKTRMQVFGSRQEATGLIVNRKINIKSEYYRNVRSMCHSLFCSGRYFIHKKSESNDDDPVMVNQLSPLEGRLSFIYYVKDRRDLDRISKKQAGIERAKGFEQLYKKFLIYKYFIASDLPAIVTEGKTDIVYLSCAIRSLSEQFPLLVRNENGYIEKLVRFIHPTYVNQRILRLGNGYSGICELIQRYAQMIDGYHLSLPISPAIVIIDNDDGGKAVFNTIKQSRQLNVSFDSNEPFFHLEANLYMIKTPSREGGKSCIEDLFSQDILSLKLNGKTFDRNKKHGDHSSYGKAEFADRVVRTRQEPSDFVLFSEILSGISDVIRDYRNRRAQLEGGKQRQAE